MTIRKRLFISNILMILVPVIATALVGLLCVGVILVFVIGGAGLDLRDTEDFNRVCLAVTEAVEHKLSKGTELSFLDALLENNGMTARVFCGEAVVYSFGKTDKNDAELEKAVQALAGNSVVSQNGRSLYKGCETINGKEYIIYLLGGNNSESSYAELKTALVVSAVLIILAISLSVALTNRFLTRFVFRSIEKPLDILTNGVHEIRDGNLDFHIEYDRNDEFLPVCGDFNEMAVRLKESVDRIQRQEQSRKELLAGISHDIRSPLTSIQAYVEGLLDGVARTPEAQRSYLTTVKAKAQDLDHMVSQLFLFSKMELGDCPDNSVRLRLDEKAAAAAAEAKEEYERHGLHLETELTPVTVTADPLQLDRVIANIMENSLKYKQRKTGLLRIELIKKGSDCMLTFDDDGPGVPEEALPRLFEAFYRGDPARKDPHKGSGLGLAIAENIITRAGGSIQAKKSKLGGLRIEIRLPCEEGSEADGENTDHRG
ncbi:HAMP domain-containing sensor histidine kinase [Ruminococcus sp. Marseille-P6503]|uniref:sensor histidine kinase n=1 Tax=Ruminococcus sp. Marseille-P6503 TaxID=2364796 RepID=UPI001FA96097|nr:HAMP domain-containing sensor histidine kinase [Ruminococcus sp. Marseille-P6503]